MDAFKNWIKKNFSRWIYRRPKAAARKAEMVNWLRQLNQRTVSKLPDASFDVFTYHGEDGILQYLLQQMKEVPLLFVDIGAGDCIKSNCANLAVHFGWEGVFIDKNEKQLSIGQHFYRSELAEGADIKFIATTIMAENVNQVIKKAGFHNDVGLLSIDIDGNDYWIWKAIDTIQPRIVVIEAKVEFGYNNVIVPYGEPNHHSANKMYNGASVEALRQLGAKKGYKLVGANRFGYNLFFVRENENMAEVATKDVLADPGTLRSFYPGSFFAEHQFE